jgi:hypothetical protein
VKGHGIPARPDGAIMALARLQRIGPAHDLEALAALWPDEFDPEAFLAHLAADRARRRRLAPTEGSQP